jgi:hypothetical protein
MKNLAKAVIAVMKEVKGMEKNSRVGSGGMAYNGTKDQDVKEVFNEALANHGLCMMPIDIQEETQIDRWEEETNYGKKQKQSVFTKVKVKYLLLHESSESVEIMGYGHGVDPQDKGAGKATTYAMKNALLYTFLTPVGKIDDSETTHSNEIPVSQAMTPRATPIAAKPTEKKVIVFGTPQFDQVVEWIMGDGTIELAKKHYSISEEVEDAIKKVLQVKEMG